MAAVTGPAPAELCVTCLVRAGRTRPTVLRAVVCGPCWAAHGGLPDASEIGPAPVVTAPSCDPVDQRHWLRALRRQGWVQDIRKDGRGNLLKVAHLVALYAQWDTLESRPTWARLIARSRLAERTVARWLQELRVRGWLVLLERGSTPATRPMALAHLTGNRAALYGLRIPLSPEGALARAERQLVTEVEHTLRAAAGGPADRPDPGAEQVGPGVVGDETGNLPWSVKALEKSFTGGSSRARPSVDHSQPHNPDQEEPKMTALRAGSYRDKAPDLSIMVPVSGYQMLAAAVWLRERLPVMAGCSRRLVRHLCKPYWRAGWSSRDIAHALDHRPGVFGQPAGLLLSPEHPVAPAQFIRSRLAAWRNPDGQVLPGYWSSRARDADAAREARRRVSERHGAAGARLLRAGERALSVERIAEHGRAARAGLHTLTPAAPLRPAAAAPEPANPRAERDQRRAQLVAQARAELARSTDHDPASSTAAATPNTSPGAELEVTGQPADADAYQRALRRARALGRAPAPRRSRRFR